MVPPHGACSVATLEGCLRAGFDAVCAEWPYWWLAEPDASSALSGWQPLDRIAGLPVIPRLHVTASDRDDMPFRAFLGQPLVLYAHHTDLKDGLDLLADRADEVRALGSIHGGRWAISPRTSSPPIGSGRTWSSRCTRRERGSWFRKVSLMPASSALAASPLKRCFASRDGTPGVCARSRTAKWSRSTLEDHRDCYGDAFRRFNPGRLAASRSCPTNAYRGSRQSSSILEQDPSASSRRMAASAQ